MKEPTKKGQRRDEESNTAEGSPKNRRRMGIKKAPQWRCSVDGCRCFILPQGIVCGVGSADKGHRRGVERLSEREQLV